MPAPPETTAVWVAATSLQPGQAVTRSAIEQRHFLPDSVPDNVISDPREVVGQVSAAPIAPGEVLSESSVLSPRWREAQGNGTIVPVRLTDPGVVHLLRVGDLVDLISADVSGAGGDTRTVATDVRIAAIPRAQPAKSGQDIPGRLVLMQVEPDDVTIVTRAAAREFLSVAWTR